MSKDYFIIEHEGHVPRFKEEDDLKHYRDFQRYEYSVKNIRRLMAAGKNVTRPHVELPYEFPIERVIQMMDEASCDILAVVPHRHGAYMNVDPKGPSMSWMIDICQQYPDRFIPGPVLEPSVRGVENAIWEIEYMHKHHGCNYCKIYPPGELWLLNDKRYWPLYSKLQELGITLGLHMGAGYVYGANNAACHPAALDEVCRAFYDLNILAFHFGWPWHRELNCLATCYPGLHIGMSFLNITMLNRPRFFSKLLGEAIMYAGVDKIIWSQDGLPMPVTNMFFKKFQFSEDLTNDYGFQPLTDEDRAKIFGLNMARLLDIEPVKRAKKPEKK